MLVSSLAAASGFRAAIPCAAGITVGVAGLVLAAACGLGSVLAAHPGVGFALKLAGLFYVVWLVVRIVQTTELKGAGSRQVGFFEAFGLQMVNPKAWAMALGATTTFSSIVAANFGPIIIASVFFALLIPATLVWSLFGASMKHFLGTGLPLRIFNLVMAGLIVLSVMPVLLKF